MALEKAIILHSIDYKDSGKLIYLYTESGHKSCQVHGVKKMKSSYRYLAQSGTLAYLDVSNAKLASLKEAELIDDFPHIKKDILSYTYMSHIMDLVRNVISEDSNHEKMMQFLEKIFALMDQGQDPEILSFIFELKLLYFIGYGLQFKACSICGKNEELVFHPSSGGLVCPSHLEYNDLSFSGDVISSVINLYYIDLNHKEIPDLNTEERRLIRQMIDLLYDEFVSYKTKSREILKQIKKY